MSQTLSKPLFLGARLVFLPMDSTHTFKYCFHYAVCLYCTSTPSSPTPTPFDKNSDILQWKGPSRELATPVRPAAHSSSYAAKEAAPAPWQAPRTGFVSATTQPEHTARSGTRQPCQPLSRQRPVTADIRQAPEGDRPRDSRQQSPLPAAEPAPFRQPSAQPRDPTPGFSPPQALFLPPRAGISTSDSAHKPSCRRAAPSLRARCTAPARSWRDLNSRALALLLASSSHSNLLIGQFEKQLVSR